jgi:type II secretory pathway predicted ATPase ExeA
MMSSYLDFYSLRKQPFDARPGRGPVLATRALRDALAWVVDHVESDHSLLCVSGVQGVGRSSLARVLPGRLASRCRVARIVDPKQPWPALRVAIADQLFLQSSLSRDALVGARSQGDRVVVVVDAAERAQPAFLERLDELLGMRGPAREQLVQIVLLARDPQAGPEPLWIWLEARRGLVHELDRISPNEIHGYIRKRLETAGRRPGELFSEAASRVVHRHSEGIPARVNLVCDVVLEEAARRAAPRVDARLVDETMGSAGR